MNYMHVKAKIQNSFIELYYKKSHVRSSPIVHCTLKCVDGLRWEKMFMSSQCIEDTICCHNIFWCMLAIVCHLQPHFQYSLLFKKLSGFRTVIR